MIKPFAEYQVNHRVLTTYSPLEQELTFNDNKNFLFDLSYLAIMNVLGEQSREYLQGQLTCDVRQVSSQHISQGAMCNLKGRILALMDVIDWQGFRLIIPHDLLLDTEASLAKTAMFSRVKFECSVKQQLFGFQLSNPNDTVPFDLSLPKEERQAVQGDGYYCYHLGNGFYIFLMDVPLAITVSECFIQQKRWKGSLAWHLLQMQQYRVEIYPQSRGLFLPHRLNLHMSGYLNFEKGCYKGQEIIARMHYRAKLKHLLKVFTIKTTEHLQSGQTLFDESRHAEIGELVDFSPMGENIFLIAASVILDHPTHVFIDTHTIPIELCLGMCTK
jgi:folate-binding protein YgfZ